VWCPPAEKKLNNVSGSFFFTKKRKNTLTGSDRLKERERERERGLPKQTNKDSQGT
jgi:hypothetical protein